MFVLNSLRKLGNVLKGGGGDDKYNNPNNLNNHNDLMAPLDAREVPLNRAALLIGINYPKSSCPLNGCINDVDDMAEFLRSQGWKKIDIKKEATKAVIEKSLKELAKKSHNGNGLDIVYIHYSGHGTQIPDANGDEPDKLDEAICPVDYEKCGMVSDDFLNNIICTQFNPKTKVCVVFDACHSGSCLDLPYIYNNGKPVVKRSVPTNNNVQFFSGCRDNQTSADSMYGNRPAGAMTTQLLRVLKRNPYATPFQILDEVHRLLAAEGEAQFPLLSSSKMVRPTDGPFLI
jgi:hypothetical protein